MKTKQLKVVERPTGVLIYFILLILGLIIQLLNIGSLGSGGIVFLGAILKGELLIAYTLSWLVINTIMIFGIWKRKSWLPELAVPVLALQILLTIGQGFFLEQTMEYALSQTPQALTQAQMESAQTLGKTLGYVMLAVTVIVNGIFLWVFHKNRDYFSEK